jgi:peptidoglycan hydrolase CwlO-like protein
MIQLEFDFEQSEIEKLKKDIDFTYKRVENVRKGIFQKHTLLARDISSLQEEVKLLKQQIALIQDYFLSTNKLSI